MDKADKEKMEYDHQKFYKVANKGNTDRILRAHRSRENRKSCRFDEFTRKRGVVLSPLQERNSPLKDANNTCKQAGKPRKGPVNDKRKEKLLKWRQEQVIKKKELARHKKPSSFVVRHVQAEQPKYLIGTTKDIKAAPVKDVVKPVRRSTRIAKKHVGPAPKQTSVIELKKRKGVTLVQGGKGKVSKDNEETLVQSCTKQEVTADKFEPILFSGSVETVSFTRGTTPLFQPPALLTEKPTASFAPNDFMFSAPTGLGSFSEFGKSFTLKPLSPNSAETFFATGSSWLSTTTTELANDIKVNDKPATCSEASSVPAHILRFQKTIKEEETTVSELCQEWRSTLENLGEEIPVEFKEKCDVTIGMAGVLLGRKGKFSQFKGLVAEAEQGTSKTAPTEDDLEGFWAMVAIQIEKTKQDFADLAVMKSNGWKSPEKTKVKKRVVNSKAKVKVSAPNVKVKDGEEKEARKKPVTRPNFREFRKNMMMKTRVEDAIKEKEKEELVLTPLRRSLRCTPSAPLSIPSVVSSLACPSPGASTEQLLSSDEQDQRLTPCVAESVASACPSPGASTETLLSSDEQDQRLTPCVAESITSACPSPGASTETLLSSGEQDQRLTLCVAESITSACHSPEPSTEAAAMSAGEQDVLLSPCESLATTSKVSSVPEHIIKFHQIINEEETAINALCQKWQPIMKDLDEEIPVEFKEKCDVTIGMAGVLLGRKGKFSQFKGLVAEAEQGTSKTAPTEDDLEGFWAMVAIQVDKIKQDFIYMDKIKENAWKSPEKPKLKVKKRVAKVSAPKAKDGKVKDGGCIKKPVIRPSFRDFKKNMIKVQTSEAFYTVLTPVKDKNKDTFVLTPVRRSLRAAPSALPEALPLTKVSTPACPTPCSRTETTVSIVEQELRLTPSAAGSVPTTSQESLSSSPFSEMYLKASVKPGSQDTSFADSPVQLAEGSLNFGSSLSLTHSDAEEAAAVPPRLDSAAELCITGHRIGAVELPVPVNVQEEEDNLMFFSP